MQLIKWFLWLLLFVVVVAIGGAIFLVNKVDPNDLKPQITQRIEAATGRKLELAGDLSWRFYPWVGVTINDFSLANREGFSPASMLKAEQADVQLKLLPLISKQLEIGKIKLQKPVINLSVTAQGEPNWGDLVKEKIQTSTEPEQAAGAVLGGLVIQGVDITDGEIDWNDQQAGQQYHLSNFNLTTGKVKPGEPIVFDLATMLKGAALSDATNIKLNGALWVNEALDEFKLDSLHVEIGMDPLNAEADIVSLSFATQDGQLLANNIQAKGSNKEMAGEVKLNALKFNTNSGELAIDKLDGELSMDQVAANIDANLLAYGLNSGQASAAKIVYSGQYELFPFQGEASDVQFDVNANTLAIAKQSISSEFNSQPIALSGEQFQIDIKAETVLAPTLDIQFGEAQITGDVSATQLLNDIQASGHLLSKPFNPRDLLAKLGLDILEEVPQTAMQSLQLETDFQGGINALALNNLSAKLDESTITGDFSMQDFTHPAYRFNLQLDQLNVDDYLNAENKATAESAGPAATIALPFASLKGLDVKGEIGVGDLRMQDLLSNDVLVKIDTSADRIQVAPLKARIYGGETTNKLVYDISGATPKVEIDSQLTSLNLGPFLQAMQMTDRLEGFGSVSAKVGSAGLSADDMIANLKGDINIDLNDGAIRGANIQKSLLEAASLYKQLKGKDLGLETQLDDKTAFSNFSSHIAVNNGVFKTKDINLKAPGLRITGGGKVDLNSDELDLKLEVAVVETLVGQGGKAVEDLKGETIPVRISGTIASPKILPDFSQLLQRELERKLSEKYLGGKKISGDEFKKTAKQKLSEKLAEKLGLDKALGWPDDDSKAKADADQEDADARLLDIENDAPASENKLEWPDDDVNVKADEEGQLLDIENDAPEPEPESLEEQLKKKLKKKLLEKLF